MSETVVAVSRNPKHTFSKINEHSVRLIEGLGVDGDTHSGVTDQHRSHVARNPNAPNLRQVHLMHAELHDELAAKGFTVAPGQMGENITTRGVDLLGLPAGTRLHLGKSAGIVYLVLSMSRNVNIECFQNSTLLDKTIFCS